jgi:hypothetical protein
VVGCGFRCSGRALWLCSSDKCQHRDNAYSFGSTLYDSAIFQTIIWRSGWTLRLAPALATDMSYLDIHLSPINYLPNAISYLTPIDRMSYYGLV